MAILGKDREEDGAVGDSVDTKMVLEYRERVDQAGLVCNHNVLAALFLDLSEWEVEDAGASGG